MKNLFQLPLGNNILPIFPAFFFPNIEYFQYLNNYDSVCVETHESFPKQTFRNRTYILSANGVQSINIPIIKEKKYRQTTSEVKICYKDNWNTKSWRAITSAYGNSPYFEYFENDIKHFFIYKYEKLLDLNLDILSYFKKRFEIETKIFLTKNYINIENKEIDFRNKFIPQNKSIKEIGEENFEKYTQCFCEKFDFAENLSCLDLLFNTGKESIHYIKKNHINFTK